MAKSTVFRKSAGKIAIPRRFLRPKPERKPGLPRRTVLLADLSGVSGSMDAQLS